MSTRARCPACGRCLRRGSWMCKDCIAAAPAGLLEQVVKAVKTTFAAPEQMCSYSKCRAPRLSGRRMCAEHLEGQRMASAKYRASLGRFCQLCGVSSNEQTINHRACLDALAARRRAKREQPHG